MSQPLDKTKYQKAKELKQSFFVPESESKKLVEIIKENKDIEETRKSFCEEWIKKRNPNLKWKQTCKEEVCKEFENDKSRHPISKKLIKIGDKDYDDIASFCFKDYKRVRQLKYKNEDIDIEDVIKGDSYLQYLLPSKQIYGVELSEKANLEKFGDIIISLYLYEKHKNLCLPIRKDNFVRGSYQINLVYIVGSKEDISNEVVILKNKKLSLIEDLLKNKKFKKPSREYLLKVKMDVIEGDENFYESDVNDIRRWFKDSSIIEGDFIDELEIDDFKNFENLELEFSKRYLINQFMQNFDTKNDSSYFESLNKYKDLYGINFNSRKDTNLLNLIKNIETSPTGFKYEKNLIDNIKLALKECEKRFMIIHLTIDWGHESHANTLIYDMKTKVLERFEPIGGKEYINLDKAVLSFFKLHKIPVSSYYPPYLYCPLIGFQSRDETESKERFEPVGYCASWSWLYIELRLSNPDTPINLLFNKVEDYIQAKQLEEKDYNFIQRSLQYIKGTIIKGKLEKETTNFKTIIRNYANFMSKIIYDVTLMLKEKYANKPITFGDITDEIVNLYFH